MSDELRQLGAIRRTATASEPITGGPVGAGPRVPAARGSASRLPPVLSKGPDPLGLLKAFRRRWKLAVGLGVVLAVVAGGLARVVLPHVLPRPKFEAKAVLLVAAQPPQVLFTTMDTKQQVDCGRYQKTQVAWIKSRVVLNAALERPGIKQYKMVRERGDPARWLQGDLDVNCVEYSELLEISLQGESPDEVAGLVNAVKDAYLEEVVNIEHKRRQDRYGMLRKLKDQYVETLKSKRQGLKKLAAAVGSNDRETVALKQQFAIQHLATVEQELLEVQSQKRKAGAELALAEQMDQAVSVPTVTMTAVNKAINDDSIVSQLQARLSESQARYAQTLDSMRRISRRADGDPARKEGPRRGPGCQPTPGGAPQGARADHYPADPGAGPRHWDNPRRWDPAADRGTHQPGGATPGRDPEAQRGQPHAECQHPGPPGHPGRDCPDPGGRQQDRRRGRGAERGAPVAAQGPRAGRCRRPFRHERQDAEDDGRHGDPGGLRHEPAGGLILGNSKPAR